MAPRRPNDLRLGRSATGLLRRAYPAPAHPRLPRAHPVAARFLAPAQPPLRRAHPCGAPTLPQRDRAYRMPILLQRAPGLRGGLRPPERS